MRGLSNLPFKAIYIQESRTQIGAELRATLRRGGVRVSENFEDATFSIDIVQENYVKRILSLSDTGVVREFELDYRVIFRTRSAAQPLWNEPQLVQLRRDFSYNDNAILAKAEEEQNLAADMRRDAVREILRRLSSQK